MIPRNNKIKYYDGYLEWSSIGSFKGEEKLIQMYQMTLSFEEKGNLFLTLKRLNTLKDDHYILSVNDEGVTVSAKTDAGFYYALQTLLHLTRGGKTSHVYIEDGPKYKHRGLMMDVSRHFFDKSVIFKLLDICAYLKLNVFHFHLTDDQGWRIEIDRYPKLTEVGSVRTETIRKGKSDHTEVKGFYTKEDILDIVAYANQRFIKIIPEIDIPGHFRAVLAAYPELGCTNRSLGVATSFGIFEDILCGGKAESYTFIKAVLDEVIILFNPTYLHLGCDEAPLTRWATCPACQEKIKREQLSSEMDLFGHMINEMTQYLSSKHVKSIVWNEALKTKSLNTEITIQHWMDGKSQPLVREAMTKGHNIIVSDFFHYYLDYPHFMTPLEKVYQSRNLFDERSIMGYEAALWTEHVTTEEKLFQMILPRLAAVSEICWSHHLDYHDFLKRLSAFETYLDQKGISYTKKEDANPKGLMTKIKTMIYMVSIITWNDVKNIIRMKKHDNH